MAATDNKDAIIVAIELGTSRISGIAGKKKDGGMQILAYAEEPANASCIKRGIVFNIEKTTQSIRSVINKLEQSLKLDVAQVYVGIGGQSVRSLKTKVQRNLMTETYITSNHIDSMRDESQKVASSDCELLENFPQSYSVDSRIVDEPVGVMGTTLDGEYLNVIGRRSLRNNIENCFSNTDVRIAELKLSAYELADKVLTDQEKYAGCALVNLGAGTTTVVVYKNNIVRHLVTLPIGSFNITQDLTDLQIDENEANAVKMQYGNAYINPNDAADENGFLSQTYVTTLGRVLKMTEIQPIVEARLTEIIANVKNQILNSGYASQLLGGIVLTGGGAAMRNIDKAFADYLKAEKVRLADHVNVPVIKNSNVTNFSAESVASTSILALLHAGEINCVGEKITADPDIFVSSQREQEVADRREKEQKEAQQEADALAKLEEYKNGMREFIAKLNEKCKDVRADDSNKRLRDRAQQLADDASDLLGEPFEQAISVLDAKEKNRQIVREARELEELFNKTIDDLLNTIKDARNKNRIFNRFRRSLEDMINGES